MHIHMFGLARGHSQGVEGAQALEGVRSYF